MPHVKVIALDLDDTLVNYSEANERASRRLVEGEPRFRDCSVDEFVRTWNRVRRHQTATGLDGSRCIWEMRHERMSVVCQTLGIKSTGSELEEMTTRYFSCVDAEIAAFPDVRSALDRLAPYRIVVATNGAKDIQARKIELAGLAPLSETMIASAEIGVAKPDTRFYEHLLLVTGVPAEACVMVGDSLRHDVLPAAQLGIRAFLLDRRGRARLGVPAATIRSLDELADSFRSF